MKHAVLYNTKFDAVDPSHNKRTLLDIQNLNDCQFTDTWNLK